jgi:hypothetical protein
MPKQDRAVRKINDAWRPFSTLQGFVRLVLLVDWDPIVILGYANAMDETIAMPTVSAALSRRERHARI